MFPQDIYSHQQPSDSQQYYSTHQPIQMPMATAAEATPVFHVADFPFYRVKLLLNLGIASAANALAFALIIWASPKHIRIYRWFLLDILLSAFLMDVYFMVILQPLALLPVAGYCTLGLLKFAGTFYGGFIGILSLFFLLGFCGASALAAAVYRLFSVHNLQHRMTGFIGIAFIIGLHLLITSPLQIVAGFVVEEVADQEPIKERIYERYQGVRELLNSSEICVYSPLEDSFRMRLAVYTGIAILIVIGLIGTGIVVAGFFSLWLRRARLSERLYRMHWQLSLSLLCQLLVPGITLYIPFFIVALSLFYKLAIVHDLVQFYAFVFSMHSTLNAVVMIAFTRPYRRALLKWVLSLQLAQWLLGRMGKLDHKGRLSVVYATEMEQKRLRTHRIMKVLSSIGT